MIPEVYDTERDIRIRNADETEEFVPVNTTAGAALRGAGCARPRRYAGHGQGGRSRASRQGRRGTRGTTT